VQHLAGTGLRNVRGLLRKPEASLLVQKMQTGELQPGKDLGLQQSCARNRPGRCLERSSAVHEPHNARLGGYQAQPSTDTTTYTTTYNPFAGEVQELMQKAKEQLRNGGGAA
jgi:hypothetical protein